MILGTGAAWFDFDRDEDLDSFVAEIFGPNRLFRTDGDVALRRDGTSIDGLVVPAGSTSSGPLALQPLQMLVFLERYP
ncbi:hypothetical protein ACFLRO_00380 [Bacteroidota bacterium]